MNKYIIILLISVPFALNAQMSYVPDDNFEQALIDLGLDTPPLNDSIPTKNIDTVTILDLAGKYIGGNLTGINDFVSLIALNCSNNNLWELDISNLKNLEELYCPNNYLTDLNISSNLSLKFLTCYQNRLISLDISHNTNLLLLDCSFNYLNSLDVSKNLSLLELICGKNKLSDLDVTNNTKLSLLYCWTNQITSLDVSHNPELQRFECDGNKLRGIDVSNNHSLQRFNCSFNFLTNLDVSKNSSLIFLNCVYNQLRSLNVKNGNNKNMVWEYGGHFGCNYNVDLKCIQVDDSVFSANNVAWTKDSTAHYSNDCGYSGVDDFNFDYKYVSISPNPATDYIEIKVGAQRAVPDAVVVYDLLGVEVISGIPTPPARSQEGLRIDISHLSPGVYFVRVGDVVRKFVKL